MKTKFYVLAIAIVAAVSLSLIGNTASRTSKVDDSTVIRQFYKTTTLSNGLSATVTVIAYQSEEEQMNAVMEKVLNNAVQLDSQINSQPDGELQKINSTAKGETVTLSDDMYNLVAKSCELSAMTKGWFDIAQSADQGVFQAKDYRKIKLNDEAKTLTFKTDDMKIDISRIWPAYLADKMMADLTTEGLMNAKVDVGIVSRNVGHDIHTPWRVSLNIPNPESNYAYRSFEYSFSNKAVALLSSSNLITPIVDPKSGDPVPNHFQNVMVFGNDSMTASALALALYTMGPKDAVSFTESHPEVKSIIVDDKGNFINSKHFLVGRPSYMENAAPAVDMAAPANGGENVTGDQPTQ